MNKLLTRLVFSLFMFFALPAQAAVREYVRDYEYFATSLDSEYSCRIQAIDGVKRDLVEELGTYVQSVMKLNRDALGNEFVSEDIVTLSAGVIQLEVLQERWTGKSYWIRAKIKADKDEVLKAVKALQENHELEDSLRESNEDLNKARQLVKALRQQLEQKHSVEASRLLVKTYTESVQDIEVEFNFQSAMQALTRGDFDQALASFKQLAQQGNARAQSRLGVMYQFGIGVEIDYDRAYSWYLMALQGGHTRALALIGFLYERGLGLPVDYRKAAEYYQQATRAGDALGMVRMGYLYLTGVGVNKNIEMAVRLFNTSAEASNALGMGMLGFLFEQGIGVDKDLARAISLYRRAANKGNGYAMARLGNVYLLGRGVEQDLERAHGLILASVRRGNPLGIAKLGFMYERGLVVARDFDRAFELYRKAADMGAVFAWFRLGFMYEKGLGIGQDLELARNWYRKAADYGHKKARKRLQKISEQDD